MNPETKEEFDDFSKAVLDKITSLSASDHFQDFAEEFVRDLCMSLNVQTLKKCSRDLREFQLRNRVFPGAVSSKVYCGQLQLYTYDYLPDRSHTSL